MERYNIQRDHRQLVVSKRWTAYAGSLLYGFWTLGPLLIFLGFWWRNPRTAPHLPQIQILLFPIAVFAGCGLYALWKIVRGGDRFVFNAQTRLFERNGRVVSHWDGIVHLAVVDVPHRQRRSGLLAILGEDEFRHTYRLVVQLTNGKKHVVDECGSRQVMEEIARDIGSYANLPVTSDVANVNWLG